MHQNVNVPDQEISVIKFPMIVMVLRNMTPCTLFIGNKAQEDSIPSIFRADLFFFRVNCFTLKMETVGPSEMLVPTCRQHTIIWQTALCSLKIHSR
jgi:hypothetical protein